MKAKRLLGTCFVIIGLLLVAAALCLTVYNVSRGLQAGKAAYEALNQIREMSQANSVEKPDTEDLYVPDYVLDPNMPMPYAGINGECYIGVLDIPALELSLPVIRDWTYLRLNVSPCRYQGSVYLDNMIIMAHNFDSHFGRLTELKIDDEIYFTDMAGNVFAYRVTELETLGSTDVEQLNGGEWDLTLLTCTLGGNTRVTVRCDRALEE